MTSTMPRNNKNKTSRRPWQGKETVTNKTEPVFNHCSPVSSLKYRISRIRMRSQIRRSTNDDRLKNLPDTRVNVGEYIKSQKIVLRTPWFKIFTERDNMLVTNIRPQIRLLVSDILPLHYLTHHNLPLRRHGDLCLESGIGYVIWYRTLLCCQPSIAESE